MNASELCSDLILTDASRAVLVDEMEPWDFIETLVSGQHYQDAVSVLSRSMPVRERVWWACYCARQCSNFATDSRLEAAVQAAEAWVADGSEASRYRAFEAAQLAPLGSAPNCAAMAAFASAGSMAPADAEPMPPPAGLDAQLAAGAVTIASVAEGPDHAVERYKFFIEQGKQLWQSAAQSAA